MRRLTWCAIALAAACGSEGGAGPAPLTRIRQPTGLAVHEGRVLVLSSNADLTYDEETGGSLLSLQVDPARLTSVSVAGGVLVRSMGGELAVARATAAAAGIPAGEACGAASDLPAAQAVTTPLAVFGTRGSNTLNAVAIASDGALSCAGPAGGCGLPTNGVGFGDPLAVAVACGGGRARAYFGYLNAHSGVAWVGELNLTDDDVGPRFSVRNAAIGLGPVRGFAYDRDRDRLYMTGTATGAPTPLRWLELTGCTLGATGSRGCSVGSATLPVITGPYAIELHGIALANPAVPGVARGAGEPIRAYLTGVIYDAGTASGAGYRTSGFGSVLVVADLHDDARGGVEPWIVAIHAVPPGAQAVRVLPRPAAWPAARRDVVAVVSVDTGSLTILDDETGAYEVFGVDSSGPSATGGPLLGHQLYGLGVDPVIDGNTAHLWVGSFGEGFVTPIDVTLDPTLAATFAGGAHVKITGATTP